MGWVNSALCWQPGKLAGNIAGIYFKIAFKNKAWNNFNMYLSLRPRDIFIGKSIEDNDLQGQEACYSLQT